ncbi:MAG: serpin family protein [Bacteroidota bacterium]|nr:serpin family protein [Bacteroidota bacterium]
MKTYKFPLVMLVITCLFASCRKSGDDLAVYQPKDVNLTQTAQVLVGSSNAFGFDLFKEMSKSLGDSNLFISPVSVSLALAMTYNGADGTTREAMAKTLKITGLTTDDVNASFQNLMQQLTSLDSKVALNIANSIWYRNTFTVLPDFLSTNQKYFNAQVQGLDFSSPSALTTINGWVADKTKGKIKTIIDQISDETVMYLINAVYFKGSWLQKFDAGKTSNQAFTLEDNQSISIPTMVTEGSFDYTSNDLFSSVRMFYGQGNYSMCVLLPNEGKTVNDIINNLTDENWNSWTNSYHSYETVHILLPKFKFAFGDELKQYLSNLGMGIAFNTDSANFSKINNQVRLCISKVKHKSYVDVNEEGTEAAAVTSVEIICTSAGPMQTIYFTVNRPFIFVIREEKSNTVIFIGKVMKPVIEG